VNAFVNQLFFKLRFTALLLASKVLCLFKIHDNYCDFIKLNNSEFRLSHCKLTIREFTSLVQTLQTYCITVELKEGKVTPGN